MCINFSNYPTTCLKTCILKTSHVLTFLTAMVILNTQ